MGELVEPWRTAAERAGVRQTYRGIGEAAGISHVTIRRLISQGRTSPETIAAVSRALGVDEATIEGWVGISRSDWGPWQPPAQAQHLNPRARAALAELILAITEGGQDEDLADPAQKSTDLAGGETTRDDVTLAARRMDSQGKRLHAELDQLGEESQDDGGVGSA